VQDLQRQTSQLSKSEQEYQQLLKERVKQIDLQKRLNRDLREMGLIEGGKDNKNRWQEIAMGASKVTAAVMLVGRAFESAGKAAQAFYRNGTLADAVSEFGNEFLGGIPARIDASVSSIIFGRSEAALGKQLGREDRATQEAAINSAAYAKRFALKREQVAVNSRAMDAGPAFDWEMQQLAEARKARAEGRDPTDPRLLDAQRAYRGSVADKNAAGDLKDFLVKEQRELEKSIAAMQEDRKKIEDHYISSLGGNGNKFDREADLSALRQKDTAILAEQAKLQDILNQKKAAAADLDQKSFIAKQRGVDLARAELAITTEKYQKAKANEESFAAMSAGDKLGVLYALQDVQKRGVAAQPQEVRDLLLNNPLTSEYTRKLIGKEADNDPILAQVAGLMGVERASLLEKQKIKLEEKIVLDVAVNTKEFAEQVKKTFETNKAEILQIIEDAIKKQFQLLDNPRRQTN
jgi:hypothetical protein